MSSSEWQRPCRALPFCCPMLFDGLLVMLDADNQIDHSFHICYTKEAEFLIVGMILSFGITQW
jgi:hypothetical protein